MRFQLVLFLFFFRKSTSDVFGKYKEYPNTKTFKVSIVLPVVNSSKHFLYDINTAFRNDKNMSVLVLFGQKTGKKKEQGTLRQIASLSINNQQPCHGCDPCCTLYFCSAKYCFVISYYMPIPCIFTSCNL